MLHHRELTVWQKSMDMVVKVYHAIDVLPQKELYALSSQIRRSAVSVPSNIAEGAGRKSPREFARFLRIAYGSLSELETQLILCIRLHYITEESLCEIFSLTSEIGKMLNKLILKMESSDN